MCLLQVWHSLIYTVAPHQVRRSLIYTVCLPQVHHSPISSVTPLQGLHQSPLLRCYSCTILQWFSICELLFFVMMLLVNYVILWLCYSSILYYQTILLPMWICLVDYLTASLKSKFLQLRNMLPPVDEFILLSWFSSIN